MSGEQRRAAMGGAGFGKVAVLLGGRSAEREISLLSGEQVLEALRRAGVDAQPFDPAEQPLEALRGFDRAFVALHGRGGEDGAIQGALEWLGIPYTGSGVLGSALAMDKLRTKQLWRAFGMPTPEWIEARSADELAAVRAIDAALAVKPAREGSSIGITKVTKAAELETAWRAAAELDGSVIVERWIEGDEYTVAILEDAWLPLIKLETPNVEFYDYQAKYFREDTVYRCPCGLPPDEERALGELSLRAFRAVGASGWGRVDLMLDRNREPWLLEVNTVPGMTTHSLVPMAARAAGVDFDELCLRILAGAAAGGAR
jgi:D-alanine-D-alanine ligase